MMAWSLKIRKGSWTEEEDILLRQCINKYGEGNWRRIPLRAGLRRCPKSCRLRWVNYLRSDIKKGEFGEDEVDLLLKLHKLLGNRFFQQWSAIESYHCAHYEHCILCQEVSHKVDISRKTKKRTSSVIYDDKAKISSMISKTTSGMSDASPIKHKTSSLLSISIIKFSMPSDKASKSHSHPCPRS